MTERLPRPPQSETRALLETLHLQLAYQPAALVVDVDLTLLVDEPPDRRGGVAELWSVPLIGPYSNPSVQEEIARLHEVVSAGNAN